MHMTSRNIILFVLAAFVGIAAGLYYPIIGLILLPPVLIFLVFILLRNRGAKEADPAAAEAARQFTAPPGMAAIYVMRHGFVGGQQGMNVSIGGLNSQFRTGRFVRAEVAPGTHEVRGRLAAQIGGTDKVHQVTLAPGECVLLDAKLDMGALQSKLVFLETRNPDEAREKLARLKLVEWKAPPGAS